jgi:hypothetical protein
MMGGRESKRVRGREPRQRSAQVLAVSRRELARALPAQARNREVLPRRRQQQADPPSGLLPAEMLSFCWAAGGLSLASRQSLPRTFPVS